MNHLPFAVAVLAAVGVACEAIAWLRRPGPAPRHHPVTDQRLATMWVVEPEPANTVRIIHPERNP